jgi:hypothetical protein
VCWERFKHEHARVRELRDRLRPRIGSSQAHPRLESEDEEYRFPGRVGF